jgi:hypothetical protein
MRDSKALRNLDCLVARWVFGADVVETPMEWTTALHPRTQGVKRPPNDDFPVMFKLGAAAPESVPRFSADNQAVQAIVAQLANDAWQARISESNAGSEVVLTRKGDSTVWQGDGATAGEAACVAAIRAKGVVVAQ